MDNGKGSFVQVSEKTFGEEVKEHGTPPPKIFIVGEILKIRDSRFRVERIIRKKMILKLLPQLGDNNE